MVTGDYIFRLLLVVTLAIGLAAVIARDGSALVAVFMFDTALVSSWFLLFRQP